MKKILSLLSLAALTVGLLGSCSKINERLDNLEKDVNGLKNEKIASIESQIAGITSSIADLGTIRSDISSLKQSAENHGIDIINLEEADRALKDRIDNLEDYLDVTLPKFAEKEWVEATFSTLEQYDSTCTAIAEINVRIGELDARTARDIQACADSMKTWVNEQLDAYYTAAGMDAKLAQMKSAVDSARAANKITDAKADSIARELAKTKTAVDSAKANIRKEYKAAIKSAIDSSEARLTKKIQNKIDKVNKDVEDLAGRVSVLDAAVADLTGRVNKLEGMIQSVVIVPAYSDGSVQAIDGLLELNLIVSPSSAAKGLTKEKVNILLNSVSTKAASVDTVDTDKIKSFIVDDTKGTVEIKADISDKLNALQPKQLLTIAVNVKNGDLSDITTEFVNVDNTPGYTVTFNNNYGATPVTRDTSVLKGGKINKPADPTREGYFFDKWFTKNQSQDVEWNFNTMTVSQDTTLYAGWIQGKKVTFRKDTVNLTVCKDTIVRPSSTVNKPANPDSANHVFKGWFTRKSDGTFDKEWNFNTDVTKDTTLFAKWAKVMTVAQLVATNSKFPVSSSQDAIPDSAWVNGSNRCYYSQNSLVFKGDKTPSTYTHDHKLTRQDDGSYQNDKATLTFVMAADRDSVVKITLNKTGSYAELNGTYAPKSSIPEGALAGEFTVNDSGKKVHFSQGNLQATYSTSTSKYTWGFAAHQYSCIGNAAGNTTIANQTDGAVVDLFGWSTGSTTYGISASKNESDYSGDFVDWGKNIGDGNTWRTLSKDEWTYLFKTRTMTNGKDRYSNAVSGVTIGGSTYNGVFLYPDNYNGETVSSSMTWNDINAAGIVFLPATGSRYEDFVSGSNNGYYWLSTESGNDGAYNVFFSSSSFYSTFNLRCNGYSVRLVTEVK